MVAIGGGWAAQFDLSNPSRPTWVRSFRKSGIAGALSWEGELLLYGKGGFYGTGSGELVRMNPTCEPRCVFAAIAARSVIYALTEAGLEVFSSELCRIAKVEAPGHERALVRVGNQLLTGGAGGVTLYSLADPERPDRRAWLAEPSVVDLALYPAIPADVVAVLEDGSARILEIAHGRIVERGEYLEAPWFTREARAGRVVAGIREGCLDFGILGEMATT
jgi:hypothetical protein